MGAASQWRANGLATLNEAFDKIFVVTLARNEARHRSIEDGLNGVDFELYWGTEGAALTSEDVSSIYDDAAARLCYGRSLSPGELGCTLSHLDVYREALRRKYETFLILEDDVVLNTSNVVTLPSVLAELPRSWDLLYLCTYRDNETPWLQFKSRYLYPFVARTGIREYDLDALHKQYSRPYSRNLRRAGVHNGAWAYAMTSRTAWRLLQLQSPVKTISDHALMLVCQMDDAECFLAVDNVFEHRSDLGSVIWKDDAERLGWTARVTNDRQ